MGNHPIISYPPYDTLVTKKFRMPKKIIIQTKSSYIIFFWGIKVACISGPCAVGRYAIMKWLYESGGCSRRNARRGCCRRTSFETYPFAIPTDVWSRCYQSKNLLCVI